MIELIVHPIELKLKETFKTAHSERDVQYSVVVELKMGEHSGYGEATMNTYYGISIQDIKNDLELARPLLKSFIWGTPEGLHSQISGLPLNNNFSLCAIDEAAYDLYGKLNKIHTYQYLNTEPVNMAMTDYTIGIDTIEVMLAKMKTTPWPIYKIKLGTEHDIEIVETLRQKTDAIFRVDANCGWNIDQTLNNSKQLAKLGVEYIEQPLPPEEWDGMRFLKEKSSLPLIADESCQVEEDVALCATHFHGINIKLTKCGGITPAQRMINQAKAMDLSVMVGCMTESSVGISAAAQLLPQLDYADLDGILLIQNDPASGVNFEAGNVIFPSTFGNGVKFNPKRN